jgi:phospholipid N-methyltransferase
MLRAMHPAAELLAIEINPRFVHHLDRSIEDPRFSVYEGCAEKIAQALAENHMGKPDLIYSGIPFSTIPDRVGRSILETSWEALAPGGRFVAYQLRDRVKTLGDCVFGRGANTTIELFNMPPMRFYSWDKPLH